MDADAEKLRRPAVVASGGGGRDGEHQWKCGKLARGSSWAEGGRRRGLHGELGAAATMAAAGALCRRGRAGNEPVSISGRRKSFLGSGCGSGGPEREPPRSRTGGNGAGGALRDGEDGVRLWKRRNGEEKTNLASLDG